MYRPPEVHIPDDTFQSADEAVPACGYGQNQFQEFFQVIPDRSMHDNNPNWLSSAQHIRCQFHEDHSVSDLSVFAGMAGTLYAMNFSTVTASKFDFNTSILILVFVVLGGLGNIWGSIIAAALLTVLPELLRSMNDYRMLIYAILLIVMMIFNNSGAKKRLTEYFSAQKEKRTAKKAAGKGVN